MPTGVPLMMGSATLTPLLRHSVLHKLGVADRYAHLPFSNDKPNIAISVRILEHKLNSYADLLPLFTKDINGVVQFVQTLIYVNSRKEAEEEFQRLMLLEWAWTFRILSVLSFGASPTHFYLSCRKQDNVSS
ncbi:hypothetical protein K438DRAFT_1977942 [Mycena galopus ATCC 62051]|nr:hypothetical protein K438DRAFT_1977942 [Mycena galopus ATCC 62051]